MSAVSRRDAVIEAANSILHGLIEEDVTSTRRSPVEWMRIAEEALATKQFARDHLTTDEDRLHDLEAELVRLERLKGEATQKLEDLKKRMGEAS